MKYFQLNNVQDDSQTVTCTVGTSTEYYCSAIMNATLSRGEFVSCAAVRHSDDLIIVVTRPGTHDHIASFLKYFDIGYVSEHDEGFLTTAGRYMSKEQAFDLAVRNKQLTDDLSCRENQLQCSDLW